MNCTEDVGRRRRLRELVRELGALLRRMPDQRAEPLLRRSDLTEPERDDQRGAA